VFQIGATTKAFLTATMAIMVDRGKLRWDDRVGDLYPEFRLKDPWVTREFRVFDLPAQRSGLPPLVNDILVIARLQRGGADSLTPLCQTGVEFPHDLRLYQHHASVGEPHRGNSGGRSGLECGASEGTARSLRQEGVHLHSRSYGSGSKSR